MGEWSEAAFIQIARRGKHQGQPNGRDILPPMPWFNMKRFDRGRLEGDVGVPAEHSAGQKSGAVPDTPAGSSKPQSKIETANWN